MSSKPLSKLSIEIKAEGQYLGSARINISWAGDESFNPFMCDKNIDETTPLPVVTYVGPGRYMIYAKDGSRIMAWSRGYVGGGPNGQGFYIIPSHEDKGKWLATLSEFIANPWE
jgi:hypothetical protein